MNCLNSNYKRLIDAALDCEDEEETNVDELRATSEKTTSDTTTTSAAASTAASTAQQPAAPRYEYRTDGKTRILPIKRGGEKQSETHYFVIPPPVFRVPLDESDSHSHSHSHAIPSLEQPQTGGTACASAPEVPDRSVSEREKVTLVTSTVHGVTDEEAKMALSMSRMNVQEACRYLAVEQLFRLGFSREQSARALAAAGGSLEKASAALLAARFSTSASASNSHSTSTQRADSAPTRSAKRT